MYFYEMYFITYCYSRTCFGLTFIISVSQGIVLKPAIKLDLHDSVHRDIITKATNKLQLYKLIYYS
jgi:hypothetical protein